HEIGLYGRPNKRERAKIKRVFSAITLVPGEGIEPPTNGLQNRFQPLDDLNNSANCALFDTN
ncbi:MAG: hypothetical protein WBF44_11110, partial [Pseudolabrys sp.]